MVQPFEAIYLFDPLCGWCYGASPMIAALATQPGAVLDLVPVGLFAGAGAFTLSPAFRQHVVAADARIAAVSGQLFSDTYRENVLGATEGMVDSGPATLALTAVRLEAPTRELEVLKRLQQARYVDGRDITRTESVAEILAEAGLGAAAARIQAPDAELLQASEARTSAGRDLMQRFDIRGVPALLVGRGRSFSAVPSSVLFGRVSDLLAAVG